MIDQLALGGIVVLMAGYSLVTVGLCTYAIFVPKSKKQDGVNSGAKFG